MEDRPYRQLTAEERAARKIEVRLTVIFGAAALAMQEGTYTEADYAASWRLASSMYALPNESTEGLRGQRRLLHLAWQQYQSTGGLDLSLLADTYRRIN